MPSLTVTMITKNLLGHVSSQKAFGPTHVQTTTPLLFSSYSPMASLNPPDFQQVKLE